MQEESWYLQMRESLSRQADIRDAEWELLKGIFRVRRLGRSDFALKTGDLPKHIFFVCSGLLRYYYGSRDEKQSNKVFIAENMFTGPITGCPEGSAAGCGIQALEPTVALVADAAAFNALYDMHPIFDRLGRKLGEWWLGHKEARARAFQTQNASERYLGFIRSHPDLAQRIPQYHIASYLGITEISLSRIRKGLSRPAAPNRKPTSSRHPGSMDAVTRT
jgi:CRP-like cAMP-binding protein